MNLNSTNNSQNFTQNMNPSFSNPFYNNQSYLPNDFNSEYNTNNLYAIPINYNSQYQSSQESFFFSQAIRSNFELNFNKMGEKVCNSVMNRLKSNFLDNEKKLISAKRITKEFNKSFENLLEQITNKFNKLKKEISKFEKKCRSLEEKVQGFSDTIEDLSGLKKIEDKVNYYNKINDLSDYICKISTLINKESECKIHVNLNNLNVLIESLKISFEKNFTKIESEINKFAPEKEFTGEYQVCENLDLITKNFIVKYDQSKLHGLHKENLSILSNPNQIIDSNLERALVFPIKNKKSLKNFLFY